MDSQPSEDIAKQKGTPTKAGTDSPFRNRSIAENKQLFKEMKAGKHPEGAHVLRAKIDMASANMLLRDPVMYRIMYKTHTEQLTIGVFIHYTIGRMVNRTMLSKSLTRSVLWSLNRIGIYTIGF